MRRAIALTFLAVAAAARADSVTNQILVSSTHATEANPRSSVFTDFLNASFNGGEDWTLSAGASLTLQGKTPAATRGQFGESSSAVTFFTVAADWSVTDSFTVGASVDLSPKSTQFAGTTIPVALPPPPQCTGTPTSPCSATSTSTTRTRRAAFSAWRRRDAARACPSRRCGSCSGPKCCIASAISPRGSGWKAASTSRAPAARPPASASGCSTASPKPGAHGSRYPGSATSTPPTTSHGRGASPPAQGTAGEHLQVLVCLGLP